MKRPRSLPAIAMHAGEGVCSDRRWRADRELRRGGLASILDWRGMQTRIKFKYPVNL